MAALVCPLLAIAARAAAGSAADPSADGITYTVALEDPARHLVHVTMHLPAASTGCDVLLPVWNGLYQVRDFSQYIMGAVTMTDSTAAGSPAKPQALTRTGKSSWRVEGAHPDLDVEYRIHINVPGPFGSQLNSEHAFLNLAWILMDPLCRPAGPMSLEFARIPEHWKLTTSLPRTGNRFVARSYDQIVDSPVEIGRFHEIDFKEGGASYSLAIDANPADYDAGAVTSIVRRIVTETVEWMQDRPFEHYLFLYHFRRDSGGGMEHADSTAIDIAASSVRDNAQVIANVSAHEFFHLWNVKRIRPAGLEPVDYTHENFTRALWFSEGVTSTVADYILLRARMTSEKDYLNQIASAIETLENRPAHLAQSAEDSSYDTWFDKYSFYRGPDRSISYYNKGEILGVLLDLAIRDATGGRKSLRELFQWLNVNYAKKNRFFPEPDGIRTATEALTGKDFHWFFQPYVAGVKPLPYDLLFATVGLKLQVRTVSTSVIGFRTSVGGSGLPVVSSVNEGSPAQMAGLTVGDTIVQVNGKPASDNWSNAALNSRPGDTFRLEVRGEAGDRELTFAVSTTERKLFDFVYADDATPAQRARRAAWLRAESEADPSSGVAGLR